MSNKKIYIHEYPAVPARSGPCLRAGSYSGGFLSQSAKQMFAVVEKLTGACETVERVKNERLFVVTAAQF